MPLESPSTSKLSVPLPPPWMSKKESWSQTARLVRIASLKVGSVVRIANAIVKSPEPTLRPSRRT